MDDTSAESHLDVVRTRSIRIYTNVLSSIAGVDELTAVQGDLRRQVGRDGWNV